MTAGEAPGAPAAPAVPAVQAVGLHASIGGSHVLQGIDLSVPAGAVTALLGRNGVGKTTTLRSLIGLVPPAGTIRVLGRDVAGWPPTGSSGSASATCRKTGRCSPG